LQKGLYGLTVQQRGRTFRSQWLWCHVRYGSLHPWSLALVNSLSPASRLFMQHLCVSLETDTFGDQLGATYGVNGTRNLKTNWSNNHFRQTPTSEHLKSRS